MPRNGSGVYSLPAGVLVTNGDVTDASQHNPALQDFASDANEPRPIVAGGTGATSASAARSALGVAASSRPTIEGTATFTGEIVTPDIESGTGSFSGQLSANGVMRSAPTVDATLSSTGHAYQIGPTSGGNLAIDADSLQARNNGAGSTIHLNYYGGAVAIGNPFEFNALSLNGALQGNTRSVEAVTLDGTSDNHIITPKQLQHFSDNRAIGRGQSWQNVSGSRSVGTSYQNGTGRPIQVAISFQNRLTQMEVSSNGSTWIAVAMGAENANDRANAAIIIPVGHYYRLTTGAVVHKWAELR